MKRPHLSDARIDAMLAVLVPFYGGESTESLVSMGYAETPSQARRMMHLIDGGCAALQGLKDAREEQRAKSKARKRDAQDTALGTFMRDRIRSGAR